MHYLSVDIESDGLYGPAFAVGAVVVNEKGVILDSFSEKCLSPKVENPWVVENCLPYLSALPECETRRELRDHFWSFYSEYKDSCTIVADVPYPVEAGFFRACVEDDVENRMFEGPFPLIDVASVLLAKGIDPNTDRLRYSGLEQGNRHDPYVDALASVLCLIKALDSSQSNSQ